MNIYIVVEGTGEKILYPKWIKYINPSLRLVDSIEDVKKNNFIIFSGRGYPNYKETIKNGAQDVNDNKLFDLLVVSVDSEDMSYDEKYNEIKEFIEGLNLNIDYKIIIQNFCLETWALGNRIIVPRNPNSELIREYLNFYDVLTNDPENLPYYPKEKLNRAQFAFKYLKTILNDRYRNLSYMKNNPRILTDRKFFNRIKSRYSDTNQIISFKSFLDAFN